MNDSGQRPEEGWLLLLVEAAIIFGLIICNVLLKSNKGRAEIACFRTLRGRRQAPVMLQES